MLSDTVGFVRDLPHHLVASFKATLEEAVHSHLLLIVLDVADPNARQQIDVVHRTLDDIGADQQPRQLVLNKIDKLEQNADLLILQRQHPSALAVSAATGVGLSDLVELVRSHARGAERQLQVRAPLSDGKTLNLLETRAEVLERDYGQDEVTLTLRVGGRTLDQLRSAGARFEILPNGEPQRSGWTD